jgi:DNA primase
MNETIGSLRIEDEGLVRLRSIAFDASFSGVPLEKGSLETILREAGLGTLIEELNATNTLAFSFLRGNAEYNRAVHDLSATIEALAAIPSLDAALREATDRLGMEMSEAQWSEQQRLREALVDARRALTDLAQGGDGGGV